jgi:hypothetical protein
MSAMSVEQDMTEADITLPAPQTDRPPGRPDLPLITRPRGLVT